MVQSDRRLNWLGFGFFWVCLSLGLWGHPLWGDELQAWGIARETRWPWELWQGLRYEGHPLVWYLLLWPLAHLGLEPDPHRMKLLHSLIGAGWLGLIWFRSPFGLVQRCLLCCSYPLFYDYALYSRSYPLAVLLILALAAEVRGRALWLLLLVNTHFLAALASLALVGAGLRLNRFQLGVYAGAWVLLAATVLPSLRHPTAKGVWVTRFTHEPWLVKLANLGSAFFPWGKGWEHFDQQLAPVWGCWALVLGLGLTALTLRRYPRALAALLVLALVYLAFFYLMFGGRSWHAGLFWVTLVAVVWRLDKARTGWPFALLLLLNAACGLRARQAQPLRPFSYTEAAADWIRQQGLRDQVWLAYPTFPTSGIFVCLDRPFYSVQSDSWGIYTRWGLLRMSPDEFTPRVRALLVRQGVAYLALEGLVPPSIWESMNREFVVQELQVFKGAHFENYVLFRLTLR